MNPLEIVLTISGIIIIIISCILTNRNKEGADLTSRRALPEEVQFTEDEIRQMKAKLEDILSTVSEEVTVRTDDELGRLSNEKIIAVNEFSEQVLEKIKRNHEEVVFLYNMLNDKEKELKAAVKEIDSAKKKVHEIVEARKEAGKEQQPKKAVAAPKASDAGPKSGTLPILKDRPEEKPVLSDGGSNNNDQILTLYSKGKSIIEISKLLGLGQGEVKLVIDLFRGRKA